MDPQADIEVRREARIEAAEACELIQDFLAENTELDGIYKIQLDEIWSYMKAEL